MGAGAVGAYYGARLQQAGEDVTLCARGDNLRALKEHGLDVKSFKGDFQVKVSATGDPAGVRALRSDSVRRQVVRHRAGGTTAQGLPRAGRHPDDDPERRRERGDPLPFFPARVRDGRQFTQSAHKSSRPASCYIPRSA